MGHAGTVVQLHRYSHLAQMRDIGHPQSQSAVFTRAVVHDMNPQAAISAPRWLLGRTWGQSSDSSKREGRFARITVQALRARGHDVDMQDDFDEVCRHAGCEQGPRRKSGRRFSPTF